MFRFSVILLSLSLLFPTSVLAKGGFVFWSYGGEKFQKVADLPDTWEFKINDDYVDIGVIYKSIDVFFLPLWNYDRRYVAVIPNSLDSYYDLSPNEINELAVSANIDLPAIADVELTFWEEWGGKLVLLLLIAMIVFYVRNGSDEHFEPEIANGVKRKRRYLTAPRMIECKHCSKYIEETALNCIRCGKRNR